MSDINHPIPKVIGAAASAGAGAVEMARESASAAAFTWGEVAAILGSIYTVTVLAEWWWKRLWRPFLIRRGWWSTRSPYFRSDSDSVPLDEEKR